MPGPKPTPSKVLELRGSWRAAARKGEPQPEIKIPNPPYWLTDQRGIEMFKELADEMAQCGYMTRVDKNSLALACRAFTQYLDAADDVEKNGYCIIYENDRGETSRSNPAVAARDKAWDQFLKGLEAFGLTPSSRTRVRVGSSPQKKGKESVKEKLFKTG